MEIRKRRYGFQADSAVMLTQTARRSEEFGLEESVNRASEIMRGIETFPS